VLYLLLNNYADHEAVFLASAIACDERSIKENPKYMNKVVAPTLDVVRSCSGFHTLPDYSFETMPISPFIGGYKMRERGTAMLPRLSWRS
jgi:hypothetical protein